MNSRTETDAAVPRVGTPTRYVADGKLVEGNGRLFLANDDNEALKQFTGERRLEDWKLQMWGRLLQERFDRLSALGTHYFLFVPPDSHAIYPEQLPAGVTAANERPIYQLLRFMEREHPDVSITYLLDALSAGRDDERLVYAETDTHWNDFGAFLAYEAMMDRVERVAPVRRVTHSNVVFFDSVEIGDLGYKLNPHRDSVYTNSLLRQVSARLVSDNRVENRGGLVVTECPAAPPVTCVMFGDSYSYHLLKYLSESFGRLVFAHIPTVELDLVEQERPAVVLSLMVERHLVVVPSDTGDERRSELARMKVAEGRVRDELPHWRYRTYTSPGNIERVRQHLLVRGQLMDATLASTMGYAGLIPRELLNLRWSDVHDSELVVPGRKRPLRLLEPLADDLEEWRRSVSPPSANAPVFPRVGSLRSGNLRVWREEVLCPAFEACGIEADCAATLGRTFGVLLLLEGASPKEIAAQTGMREQDVMNEVVGAVPTAVGVASAVSADEQIQTERDRRRMLAAKFADLHP